MNNVADNPVCKASQRPLLRFVERSLRRVGSYTKRSKRNMVPKLRLKSERDTRIGTQTTHFHVRRVTETPVLGHVEEGEDFLQRLRQLVEVGN